MTKPRTMIISMYGQRIYYIIDRKSNTILCKSRCRGTILCPKINSLARDAGICALSYHVPGLLTVKLDNIATLYFVAPKIPDSGNDLSLLLSKSLRKNSPQPCQNCDAIGGKSWTRATPFQDVWVPIAGCRPSTVMTGGA